LQRIALARLAISQQHARPRRRASGQLFDVVDSWHHIEVADKSGRDLKIEQFLPGILEAIKPAELTNDFRTSWSAIKRRKTTERRGFTVRRHRLE
jgi:hypothetical protein